MTRPGLDPHDADRRSSPPPPRRGAALGRSSLWADDDGLDGRSRPRRPATKRVDVNRRRRAAHAQPVPAQRRRGAVGWFFHRYGWRAYALPVLVALTVLVVLQVGRTPAPASGAGTAAAVSPATGAATAGTAPGARATARAVSQGPPDGTSTGSPTSQSATSDLPAAGPPAGPTSAGSTPAGSTPARTTAPVATTPLTATGASGVATAALPAGQNFVAQGKGTWHVVKGTSPVLGSGGVKYTFSVEVEDGIENAAADQDFAALVDAALADPRSWIGSGKFQLQRVDSGTPSFRISLTSQLTVRSNTLCGWEIHYEASCYARDVKRVAINDARWARGAVSFAGDRVAYRVYAVNHEVGHALGFVHRPCPVAGGPAPVMMQQSWSTADNDLAPLNPQLIPMDGKVCVFNPYPYPAGPGALAVTPAGG